MDIMGVFSQNKIGISAINAVSHPQNNTATVTCTIFVKNAVNLRDILNQILNVKSVYDISRVTH